MINKDFSTIYCLS